MARTALVPQVAKGPFITGAPGAGTLDLTETAADIVNFNSFPASGIDFLIVHNTDVGAQTFTLTTAPDSAGRSQDITAYSVGIGKISVFNLRNANQGFIQPDGNIYVQASTATVKFAVVKVA